MLVLMILTHFSLLIENCCDMFKRIFKKLLTLTFLFLLLTLLACIPRQMQPTRTDSAAKDSIDFHVVNHGKHFSIVIPGKSDVHNWLDHFDQLKFGRYIDFAWGDHNYYREGGFFNGVKALLWPTSSVMHVAKIQSSPQDYFRNSHVHKITIGEKSFKKLLTFIQRRFDKNQNGGYQYLEKGLYGNSGFYKASHNYYIFKNCNNWVNKGLYHIHQKTALWGGIPWFIEMHLDH